MTAPETPNRTVSALPTKEFFVYMLVRDIQLIEAIIDLVDNCVDGAMRVRPAGDYDGLEVRIRITPDQFEISDNCGGIPLDTAVRYAFRFGRPRGFDSTPHSIGQFGVGMKRALFKLGEWFRVKSSTADVEFAVELDVPKWLDKDDWDLPIVELRDRKRSEAQSTGTAIVVRDLHPSVVREFSMANFGSRLADELIRRHGQPLSRHLLMVVNGVPLTVRLEHLLIGGGMQPAFEHQRANVGDSRVDVDVYCGVGGSDPREAGWYVYCNGRLVLRAEQTEITGWGEGNGSVIPKYHNQYARFRGYVFFDSEDASALPWTTTKTAIDPSSEIFASIRQRMLVLMRPVINFLNSLDREKTDHPDGDGPLGVAVAQAFPFTLANVTAESPFKAPSPVRTPRPPETAHIEYRRPITEIEKLKRALKVTSNRAVGERTFDHYLEVEAED